MMYIILILSLLRHLLPTPPTYFSPLPHGIFPSYGFEQNDSETLAPILNLIYTGAYKVDEEDFELSMKTEDTEKSSFKISLSESRDSVTIEEYDNFTSKDKFPLSEKEIFLKNGKLVYSLSLWKDSTINTLRYFDILQNAWLTFHSSRKTRFDLVQKDSFSLDDGMKFDEFGKTIEYDKQGFLGKISSKIFYKYDADGNEIEEVEYTIIDRLDAPEHPRFVKTQDSSLKEQQASAVREWRKKMEQWENVYKLRKEEYKLTSKTFTKYDSVERKKEIFKYEYGEKDSTLTARRITYYDIHHREKMINVFEKYGTFNDSEVTTYKEDSLGHFISEQFIKNGTESSVSRWTYNEQGRCISHQFNSPPDTVYSIDTWTYDSKGNIIEYLESHNGVPSYKNRFKI